VSTQQLLTPRIDTTTNPVISIDQSPLSERKNPPPLAATARFVSQEDYHHQQQRHQRHYHRQPRAVAAAVATYSDSMDMDVDVDDGGGVEVDRKRTPMEAFNDHAEQRHHHYHYHHHQQQQQHHAKRRRLDPMAVASVTQQIHDTSIANGAAYVHAPSRQHAKRASNADYRSVMPDLHKLSEEQQIAMAIAASQDAAATVTPTDGSQKMPPTLTIDDEDDDDDVQLIESGAENNDGKRTSPHRRSRSRKHRRHDREERRSTRSHSSRSRRHRDSHSRHHHQHHDRGHGHHQHGHNPELRRRMPDETRNQEADREIQHAIAASNRLVRDEQDAEYYESLLKDQQRDAQKKREQQEAEDNARMQEVIAQSAKEEAMRKRQMASDALPAEPPKGTLGITTIALKLPRFCKKARIQRRFPASVMTAEPLFQWVESLPEMEGKESSWELVLPMGHIVLQRSTSLMDAGLAPRGLIVLKVDDDDDE